MDLYAENILDHYRHPRGQEPIGKPSVRHEEKNLSCGDALTLELVIKKGKIEKASWSGTGCAISIAAMSMLSEELEGMSIDAASALSADHLYELLGVPIGPRRFKCALLGLHTLKNALRVQAGKATQSWIETVAVED